MISKVYCPEKYQKIDNSWNSGIKQIISQIGKLELSVLFRRDRTSHFLTRDLVTPKLGVLTMGQTRKSRFHPFVTTRKPFSYLESGFQIRSKNKIAQDDPSSSTDS